MDDGYWPAFSTLKAQSTTANWQHVGEGFVKELDFGRVWLRLNGNAEGDKDDIIAEWKGDSKAFLESTLVCTHTFYTVEKTKLMLSVPRCRMGVPNTSWRTRMANLWQPWRSRPDMFLFP